MINGNNQYWQNAAMNIRKDGDEWRLAKDTVSNTYTPEDEGKVVSDGELVSQTAYPTEITENDTYDTTNYSSITVNVSGGGGGAGGSDVKFYDYDGTIVTSYSAADFANLSAMPDNPTHTGLTAQGWNWSLADAKTYVATYGKLNIGQMYITSDGKTRLYFVIPKDNLTLDLYLNLDEDTELDVDWGDNSEHTTWTSNDGDSSKSHTYSDGGKYTVAITVVSGGFTPVDTDGRYSSTLKRVEFGSGVTTIETGGFQLCSVLTSIIIPNSVESIENEAFHYCYALASIIIPNSVESIEDSAFSSCYALSSITIPNSVTSIGDSAFSSCYALASITIPNSVTSIDSEAFSGCSALASITIPNSVTSIDSEVFSDCSALASITFKPTTPPELNGDLSIPTTCVIRVPQGTLSDYTSASNYPDPSSYIYEEY